MRDLSNGREPMCETSEKGEKMFLAEELLPIGLEVGRRLLEIFGHQKLSYMVFRLKATAAEINSVVEGKAMPSTELLLAIKKTTGVSIDWLLTGEGVKFAGTEATQPNIAIAAGEPFRGPRQQRSPITRFDRLLLQHLRKEHR